jgi:hypothetical protein
MTEQIYVFTVVAMAGTLILIFGARSVAAILRDRNRDEREIAYQNLAARAAAVQGDAAARLAALQSELSGVALRLTSIETMLRSVD